MRVASGSALFRKGGGDLSAVGFDLPRLAALTMRRLSPASGSRKGGYRTWGAVDWNRGVQGREGGLIPAAAS